MHPGGGHDKSAPNGGSNTGSGTTNKAAESDDLTYNAKQYPSSNPASTLLKRRNKPPNNQHVKLMVGIYHIIPYAVVFNIHFLIR